MEKEQTYAEECVDRAKLILGGMMALLLGNPTNTTAAGVMGALKCVLLGPVLPEDAKFLRELTELGSNDRLRALGEQVLETARARSMKPSSLN